MRNKTIFVVVIGCCLLFAGTLMSCEDDLPFPIPGICEKLIYNDSERFEDAPRDPFIFNKVELDGNTLHTSVSYGGGCGEANFELIGVLSPILIYPPRVNMILSFDDQDLCEALITEELCFDLTPISASNDVGIVTIQIQGLDSLITYAWGDSIQ